jgi:hypothetical protein
MIPYDLRVQAALGSPKIQTKEEAALAVLIAEELRVPLTMVILRPSILRGIMPAEMMLALALQAGHEVWPDPANDDKAATAHGRRAGSERVVSATFTLEDAQRAGLVARDGSAKGPWAQYRDQMLWARAVSKLMRQYFPDVVIGISYVPGELDDEEDVEPTVEAEADADLLVEQRDAIATTIALLDDESRERLKDAWREANLPPLSRIDSEDELRLADALVAQFVTGDDDAF